MRMLLKMSLTVLSFLSVAPVWASNAIYKQVAPSTVWFFERGSATGVLVDVEKRLVLTAEHVVRDAVRAGRTNVQVIFAQLDKQNNVLVEKSFYGFEKKKALAIKGTLVYYDRLKDLALVQLEKVPGVPAIRLATETPRPGDSIHVIGNSTFFRGGLFSYSTGKVRNSYYFDQFAQGNIFYSLAHHAPTNRGDSGGPVLNDKGELVGIISQGTTGSGEGEQVIDQSVHVQEIRKALQPAVMPIAKSLTLTATVNLKNANDRLYVPVRLKKPVDLKLRGNGKTDLDLAALDVDAPKKTERMLVNKDGTTDQEEGNFTPGWSGVVQVVVKNLFLPNDPNKDQSLTPRNTYTLQVSCGDTAGGPICLARALPAQSTDRLQIYFEKSNANARVHLRGDGDTELNLSVSSPTVKDTWTRSGGGTDRRQLTFPVNVSGHYAIAIHNPDARQFNSYVLTID
jgi:V8-like Glu-specific endopeptidase